MVVQTLTLKMPFHRLNLCNAEEMERLTLLNTEVANQIVAMPQAERNALTSKDFIHVEIGSMWINQTIRNANARIKVKRFKRLPLEVNNQGWKLCKVGETYSLLFSLYRGRKKRIPIAVHQANYVETLEKILSGNAKTGSLKLWKSRKGIWYALISVSMDVPDAEPVSGWVGVDRGQNVIAAASLPSGMAKLWQGGEIKHLRRRWAKIRKSLQEAKKLKTVKRLESKERRIVTHINHIISKQLVRFAKDFGFGLSLEDLSGIRQGCKQRQKTKSDSGENRDFWSYYQLEMFAQYKAIGAGIPVRKRPAAYTSKTCCKCGVIGKRNKHQFVCVNPNCQTRHHSDWGASQNLSQWDGFSCSVELQQPLAVMVLGVQESGVDDASLNPVTEGSSGISGVA